MTLLQTRCAIFLVFLSSFLLHPFTEARLRKLQHDHSENKRGHVNIRSRQLHVDCNVGKAQKKNMWTPTTTVGKAPKKNGGGPKKNGGTTVAKAPKKNGGTIMTTTYVAKAPKKNGYGVPVVTTTPYVAKAPKKNGYGSYAKKNGAVGGKSKGKRRVLNEVIEAADINADATWWELEQIPSNRPPSGWEKRHLNQLFHGCVGSTPAPAPVAPQVTPAPAALQVTPAPVPGSVPTVNTIPAVPSLNKPIGAIPQVPTTTQVPINPHVPAIPQVPTINKPINQIPPTPPQTPTIRPSRRPVTSISNDKPVSPSNPNQ